MSQPDFQASFTRKNYHEPYPTVSPSNPSVTAAGKIVIISGGSKGVGLAIANAFGVASASEVILVARNETTLKQVRNSLQAICINTRFSYWAGDITDTESMTNMFDIVRRNLGEPNILILGAAYLHSLNPGLNVPEEELDRSFDVNFKANVSLVREFLGSQEPLSGFKTIINLATVAAHTRQSNMSAYGASKGAFVTWLEHVHFENQDRLRVFNLHPGIVSTGILRGHSFRANNWNWDKLQLPGSVAVWLASDEAAFLTGRFICAQWDVDELKDRTTEIQNSRYLLKMGLIGSPIKDNDDDVDPLILDDQPHIR